MEMTKRKVFRIKSWFYDKINQEARRFGKYVEHAEYIDPLSEGFPEVLTVAGEYQLETEKAVKMTLEADDFIHNSLTEWSCWIPKSVILEEVGA